MISTTLIAAPCCFPSLDHSSKNSSLHIWHLVLGVVCCIFSLSASADSWLQFDGVDDRVMVPYSDSFPTEVFTVGAWINAENITARSAIIARGEDDNSFNLVWQLYVAGDGTLEIMLEDSRENNFCYPNDCTGVSVPSCTGESVTVADGSWHQVAATRDDAGTLKLYVDGIEEISCSATGVPSSNSFHDLSIGSTFGQIGPLGPGEVEPPTWFFSGLIDEAFMWNVALDEQEMEQLFSNGVNSDATQLMGYWRFDEGDGQTVTDSSAAGNDGFLGASPEQDNADPVWQGDPARECDIGFYNGTILTMDQQATIASSIEIADGKVSAIDAPEMADCAQRIDLQGRVLMPGLIDNHVHWFDRAGRPGNNVAQMDNAFSCQDTIDILNRQVQVRSVPVVSGDASVDNFVTAIGGLTTTQFSQETNTANLTSAGLPSRQCLDNIDRPVFISAGFSGPGTANSAAESYFESRGISVAADGTVSSDSSARDALAAEHDQDDRKRETMALMGWSASVGLTSVFSFTGDPANDDAVSPLYDNGVAFLRVRQALGSQDRNASLNNLSANVDRLLNDTTGTPMMRYISLGEFVVDSDLGGAIPIPDHYVDAALLMAQNGLNHHQHAIPDSQASEFLDDWESVDTQTPISALRWQLSHVFDISVNTLDRMQALGAGFSAQSQNYAGNFGGGPDYRTAYNHGVNVSAGTDGGNLGPINPWLSIYFMVTGRSDNGVMRLDEDETLSVMQALEMYTARSAWFSFDEQELGSLELGKSADLLVLSADVLQLEIDQQWEQIRDVHSLLTVVDGKIVYSDGSLLACNGSDAYGVWYRGRLDADVADQCTSNTVIGPQMSGSWYNVDQSGHGWVLEMLDDTDNGEIDRMVAYWYTYLQGAPAWLVGVGPVEQGRANADMFITSGPDFPPDYDATELTLTPWGNLTFDFSSDTRAVASWSSSLPGFSGGSLDAALIAPLSSATDSCFSGSYYQPNEDGHGLATEVVTVAGEEMLIVYWYVYLDGEQIWLFGLGPIDEGLATVSLDRYDGAEFPPDFIEDEVNNEHWGVLTLQFSADDVALNWDSDDPDFADGSMLMVRLTGLAGHACQ